MIVKRYYAGGYRAVIDGVPVRLARKPSAHDLAWMREHAKYLAAEFPSYFNRKDRAEAVAERAQQDFQRYADALKISKQEAIDLIAKHREHMANNPLRDLSLVYDL